MSSTKKFLFIDRDGTLIEEPEDKQIDSLDKLTLIKNVIPALLQLKQAGYHFVMVSNQDGLGTESFPIENFEIAQRKLLEILISQGINFDDILICPHKPEENCECRKPKLGCVMRYMRERKFDLEYSYVIGDRKTDVQLAKNMGIKGIQIATSDFPDWNAVANFILKNSRTAKVSRKTKETEIIADIDLDKTDNIAISTGIGFFDHMLEQLAKHGGFNLSLSVKGDLEIDDHHTVEDAAIVIGEAMRKALGNKFGIGRYGFLLPMDEAQTKVALDLSGRAYTVFSGNFNRERVGELSTELVPHFFRSFADALQATLHIEVIGDNTHHMIESIFKGVGRTLRQAIQQSGFELPSTKGVL